MPTSVERAGDGLRYTGVTVIEVDLGVSVDELVNRVAAVLDLPPRAAR